MKKSPTFFGSGTGGAAAAVGGGGETIGAICGIAGNGGTPAADAEGAGAENTGAGGGIGGAMKGAGGTGGGTGVAAGGTNETGATPCAGTCWPTGGFAMNPIGGGGGGTGTPAGRGGAGGPPMPKDSGVRTGAGNVRPSVRIGFSRRPPPILGPSDGKGGTDVKAGGRGGAVHCGAAGCATGTGPDPATPADFGGPGAEGGGPATTGGADAVLGSGGFSAVSIRSSRGTTAGAISFGASGGEPEG
ncbi:MAG TPA: hypothetical protein PLU30_23985 [Verrucomicrobiae bacterium]|nr:hypothetical protein [Verrucomicrobiae bacterium]